MSTRATQMLAASMSAMPTRAMLMRGPTRVTPMQGRGGFEPDCTESSVLDGVQGGLRPERSEGAAKPQ
jgi:hypothetical protein